MILNTIIFVPVRHDFIGKALKTLYRYTDMKSSRVIVIDQTRIGLSNGCKEWNEIKSLIHLYMHSYRNLGFAKANNEGIIHGLRWKSKYITCCNDDVEFINKKWWKGILDTFGMYDNVYGVNPESPRIPLWGYGRPHGEYIDLLKYQKKYSEEDYQYLLDGHFENWEKKGELVSEVHLPDTFPLRKSGVVDAVAMWCPVFKRECFERFGLFDERYYPGGAEDYDMDARVYREKGRLLGTTKSWAWHHWGFSKDKQSEIDADIDDKLRWSNSDYLWPADRNFGKKMDPWGMTVNEKGEKVPMWRVPEIAIVDI